MVKYTCLEVHEIMKDKKFLFIDEGWTETRAMRGVVKLLEEDKIPKYERIVFGIGIGPKCYCKTAAEAFVDRLYTFCSGSAETVWGKDEAKQRFVDFCENWKNDPNLTEEEKKPLLGVARQIARNERAKYMLKAEESKRRHNSFDSVKSGLIKEKKYPTGVESEIAKQYADVANLIEKMIKKEKDLAKQRTL